MLRRAAECAEKEADVISYIYYDAGEAAPADGGLLILAVHTPDGETLYNPPHEHKVAPGSTLIVMAEAHGVQSMQRAFRSNVEA